MRRPDLQDVADTLAITEVLHRFCRGIDRMDRELTLSCWHPGGTDSHAPLYSGSATGFVEWVWPVHAAVQVTRHVLTNVLVALDGLSAGSECYWTLTIRMPGPDGVVDLSAGGRYLDRFECIDGVWAIRHRQSVRDWSRVDPVQTSPTGSHLQPLIPPNNPECAEVLGARDRTDPSYAVLASLFT